jgi:HEAT repeat protein
MRTLHRNNPILYVVAACVTSACVQDEQPGATALNLDPQAVEWALNGLLSGSPAARQRSFDLYERHWSALRSHVSDLVGSEDAPKRLAAAYLLSRLGGRPEAPLLRICLRDNVAAVRLAALKGVDRLRDRPSLPLLLANLDLDIKFDERRATLGVLARLDAAAARDLSLKFADSESWAHRRNAAQTMGRLTDEASRARLMQMLDDPVWTVRTDAAQSLASRGEVSVRPHLLRMTKERIPRVRIKAARALGTLGHAEDLERLRQLRSDDADPHVRAAAADALGSPAPRPITESRRD